MAETETSQPAPVDPAPSAPPPPPPTGSTQPRRASPVAPLLGGVLAALIGYGVAQVVPQGWPLASTQALEAQLADTSTQLAALKSQLDGLTQKLAEAEGLAQRVSQLETAPKPDMAALDSRLAALEARPAGSGGDPAELADLRATVETLKAGNAGILSPELQASLDAKVQETAAKLAAMEDAAKATAASSVTRAAVRQIAAALDSGTPYAGAAADLAGMSLPAVLQDHAQSGLPTLTGLQADFPEAARQALDAALRAHMGATWTERVTNFLRSQTGARALTPREGSDPDAILSRAEAATGRGDLAGALQELSALPPEGQAALQDWQARAQLRLEAEAAVKSLLSQAG